MDNFTHNPNENNNEVEAIILDSPSSPNFSNFSHPKPKRKRKIAALVALCVASAFIGGMTTIVALPHVYPELFKVNTSISALSPSTTPATPLNTGSTQFPVADIAKNVGPAVVGVTNFQPNQPSNFGFFSSGKNSTSSELVEAGSGSGFIIDAQNGYIVTNNHVIDGAKKITVSLSDGRNSEAKLVGADSRTDLAVLQISDTSNLTAITLGDSSTLEVGESVVAIGNPGGDDFARSVTTGVISALDRTLDIEGESSFGLIQTDAAINPGNSGGPLVNYEGKVIGINSAKYAKSGFEGMGFSIPISDALPTIEQIIKTGKASHPALYVSVSDQYNAYAQSHNLPGGAYIAEVSAGGPADKAGIKQGDVITKINDSTIKNSGDLIRELYKYNAGDTVKITLIRDGKTQDVQATLGELQSN
ncbi:S1C family serine protease [Desulfitobacterium sp.]|uniref:S1C family serine protease n=1 Tax=Desulfitobacterium sp. TaxID=49981 RepID=UPI002B21BE0D|nr:trypsin-like peptidase domain-containing protein [Desulfitobacterium sp.]MEA4902920.1 trypsin-like peptidase domain-containing protein [Desulfitobacterium sp.]